MNQRAKPLTLQICSRCGSENVQCDAFASWNVADQKWELDQTFEKGSWCSDCDGETRIEEKRLTGAAARKRVALLTCREC